MTDSFRMVAPDIYQVSIPLPFALNIVHCYLLRDKDEWAIVDTGINTDKGRDTWRGVFTALNIRPRDINAIYLTHVHPDHYGLSGWLQQLIREDGREIAVYASPREDAQADLIWKNFSTVHFGEWLIAHGMPAPMAYEVDAGMENTREMTLPHPNKLTHLLPNTHLKIGERTFITYLAEGHSDGQLMFHSAEDQLLLSGDHVLMKITPNIGLWTQTDPLPLVRYLHSLGEFVGLSVDLALPGHKALITDWRGRVEELIAHHEERLTHTLNAVSDGKHTPYEVALQIFTIGKFSPHEWRFALAEALAHLDYLHHHGKLLKQETGYILAL